MSESDEAQQADGGSEAKPRYSLLSLGDGLYRVLGIHRSAITGRYDTAHYRKAAND